MKRRTFFGIVMGAILAPFLPRIKHVDKPSKWKNYTAKYTDIDENEFMERLNKAMESAVFEKPLESECKFRYWVCDYKENG